METLAGKVIKSYELRRLLGAGSFGAVYQAHQALVEREVAIKIIWPVFANHPDFIRRFESEAKTVAELEHPYIVPLYDYWREPDGAYLVMRLLRGGHLRQAMTGTPWSVDEVARVLGQVSAALALAHRYGVVHCDLKPENILLDEEGNAYLADFGIARILKSKSTSQDDFAGMGSPAYAAPEQVAGGAVTPQSDIYSLGIIVYELLAGHHPFPNLDQLTLTQLLARRTDTPLPPLSLARPDLPSSVNSAIQHATALTPDARFPDALSFAKAFREAVMRRRLYEGYSAATDNDTLAPLLKTDLLPNPYKGLRAFQESDALYFFGRESLVAHLIERLGTASTSQRFLAIVGPSGSGKSSAVKAGLIPALRQGGLPASEQWFYVEMTPGAMPFDELRTALNSVAINPATLRTDARGLLDAVNQLLPPDDKTELFLFIDQFEEIFTLVEDEAMAGRFLDSLHLAVTSPNSRLRVVITLRADFYDRPLLYPRMSDLMRRCTEVVVPLSADELERAIVGPAQRVGVALERGLVSAIISEVNQQPGALPLLQYLLSELFDQREGSLLTLKTYRISGGVRGALARRADEIFAAFSPTQQAAARQIFLRLVTLGEGTEDTRRRALLSELTSISEDTATLQSVINVLGKSGLLTFDRDPMTRGPTLEVTHEAILREWRRLRSWLDENRADVRMQRSLAALGEDWLAAGRDQSFLLRGSRLEQYEKWAEATNLALTRSEHDFLRASINERQYMQTQEIARVEREQRLERRAQNRQRILIFVLAVAAVIGFVLTAFALSQSQIAEQERSRAESLALEASARLAISSGDSDLAIALALEANRGAAPPIQAQRALAEAAFSPGTRRVLTGHTSRVYAVDVSPDGRSFVSGSFDSQIKHWDVTTGATLRTFTGHRGDVETVAFSPDGRFILSGSADFSAMLWDVQTGERANHLIGHTAPVSALAFSPNGQCAVTASRDATLIVWDLMSAIPQLRLTGHTGGVRSVAFSPDGRFILSGSNNGELILWDAETGAIIRTFANDSSAIIQDVVFTPDGRRAASGSGDNRVSLWNIETGTREAVFRASSAVFGVDIAADGRSVFAGTNDGAVYHWDIEDGRVRYILRGHIGTVWDLAVSPDGAFLVTGANDETVRLWNIRDPRYVTTFSGHTERIIDEAFILDGASLVTVAGDRTVRFWETASGTQTRVLDSLPTGIRTAAINAVRQLLLLGLTDGQLVWFDLASSTTLRTTSAHNGTVLAVDFNSDGQSAVSGGQDSTLVIWDASQGQERRRIATGFAAIYSVAYSPDSTIVMAGGRGEIGLWNATTGERIRSLVGQEEAIFSLAFSPDGRTAISGSRDGSVVLWDVNSGVERARLLGHTDRVYSVGFNADGQVALTGSADASIILWDVATGQQLQRFANLGSPVFSASFTPDGTRAVAGQDEGILRTLQTVFHEDLIALARTTRYVRDFTCIERELYRIEPYCATVP